jgi:hypothetical protein
MMIVRNINGVANFQKYQNRMVRRLIDEIPEHRRRQLKEAILARESLVVNQDAFEIAVNRL